MRNQGCNGGYSRREFLKLASTLGGAAAVTAFLQACSQAGIDPTSVLSPTSIPATEASLVPTDTDSPDPTQQPEETPISTETEAPKAGLGIGQVAFLKTSDRSAGVRRVIEMIGAPDVQDREIFLKPNYNSPDETPGATHPEVLRSLLQVLHENQAGEITVGDRSGMGDTRRAMESLGVFELQDEFGFRTLIFDDLSPDDWVMMEPQGSHWSQGFPFARPILEADSVIQTCCLKTHQFGGHFTLSLKNTVGMVAKFNQRDSYNYMRELHSSPHQRRMIAEINTAYKPDLVVMDGVECFVDGGPATGRKAQSEVILVGTDRVALDAVGVALLRYHGCTTEVAKGKVFEQEQIQRAVELGLGVDKAEKIEFITGDKDSAAYAELIREVLVA
jgi:uncharacterized protein (DUF362 family)